jgi:hypothetical protein
MEFALVFQTSILPIFIIVGLAVIYHRIVRPDISQLTNLALYAIAPLFVFDALYKHKIVLTVLYKPLLFMIFLTFSLMAIAYVVAKIVKASDDERTSFVLACSMINVGNFGLPLIYFAFGEQAQVYSVVYFTAFNIPLCTIAIYISSREKSLRHILIDVIKIPMFHALVIALLMSGMSIPIPDFLSKSIGLISQAAIPLFIFVLGLQLASIKLKSGFVKIVLLAVCIRLIVSPALAYPFLELIGISGLERKIALVQTSAPAALLPLMYAIRFNRSPDLLAAIIVTTTLLSGVSLTALIRFVNFAP